MAEIKNPNQQGGGQDSRTMLIFTGIFLVMFLGLQYFKAKKGPEPTPNQQQIASTSTASPQAAVPTAAAMTPDQSPAKGAVAATS
ncbi:MAG: hypothetical protein WBX22_28470, partial [Silvibacterium sp.]